MHSFHMLIADLGTLCLNEVVAAANPNYACRRWTVARALLRPRVCQERTRPARVMTWPEGEARSDSVRKED